MLGGGHRVSFRLVGDEVRVDPGDVKVLAMKEVSRFLTAFVGIPG